MARGKKKGGKGPGPAAAAPPAFEPEGRTEALSEVAVELEAARALGDNVALARRARAIAGDAKMNPADQALARQVLQSLRLEPAALGFLLAGLCVWLVAFVLGVVLRQG